MIRRTLLMLLALVLVTGATACGGGGGDDASGDDTADTTESDEAEASDEEVVDEPEPDAAEDEEDAAAAPGSGEPGSVASQLGIDRTFTGEGSEAFCADMADIQAEAAEGGQVLDDATFADQMAGITPPDEIATEWTNLFTVQQALADDPSGAALEAMSDEERDAWGMSGAVVAAYLGDVCGLDDGG